MDGVENFANVAALIVGDAMLDRYWWGQARRISPEAPVPVVQLQHCTQTAGGAANVAANVAGLGARATLVSVAGADEAGAELRRLLDAQGIETKHLVTLAGRPTTVKTRVVAQGHHIVRLDQEEAGPLNERHAAELAERIKAALPTADVLVFSDYAKGLLTPALLREVIPAARQLGKPVLVDPKGRDYRRYQGATLLTPNRKEAAQVCGLDEEEPDAVAQAGRKLLETLAVDALLITQGEDGMTLFRRDHAPQHLPTRARAVYDVTGAGDTVLATLAVALGVGNDLPAAAHLANVAAGLVVEQVGTTSISVAQLRQALAEEAAPHVSDAKTAIV
jgi:D-beta-D-heptose 7-phosphate kinase/D-beta-D-heptose 1-phosphate adenosyltransferase